MRREGEQVQEGGREREEISKEEGGKEAKEAECLLNQRHMCSGAFVTVRVYIWVKGEIQCESILIPVA